LQCCGSGSARILKIFIGSGCGDNAQGLGSGGFEPLQSSSKNKKKLIILTITCCKGDPESDMNPEPDLTPDPKLYSEPLGLDLNPKLFQKEKK
jgi:hypothetical protein